MRSRQWMEFRTAARRQPHAAVPVAAIVDSPWIPGYLGLSHLDYYFDGETWWRANRRIVEEFPEIKIGRASCRERV